MLNVYISRIPESVDFSEIYPRQRCDEINSVTNPTVKKEKYFAWHILGVALRDSFGYGIADLNFSKLDSGKWICDRCCFSISHSDCAVAIAVSDEAVGIDIQSERHINCEPLASRILTLEEKDHFCSLPEFEKSDFVLKLWTAKEAIYKAYGSGVFSPKQIKCEEYELFEKRLELNGKSYFLCVSGKIEEQIKLTYI